MFSDCAKQRQGYSSTDPAKLQALDVSQWSSTIKCSWTCRYCTRRTPQIHNHIRKTRVLFSTICNQKKKIFIFTNLEFIGLLALPRRLILCQCHTAVRIKGQLGSESDPCPTCFSRRAETGGTCVEFNWASPGGVWAAHTDLKNILVFQEEPWSAEPLFGWLSLLVDEPQNKKRSYSICNSNISHYIWT